MLRTDDRALLVDLLNRPEVGFRLERAVGTTFTMQLDSLLRVPLAVAGSEWNDGADPLGVMEAVRSSADRIDAFCQTGMLSVPASAAGNPLLVFLEDCVHQVARPDRGHLFHPKVWLVSFVAPDEPRRFRLLCGSRNLTGDRAWDAVVSLDGTQGPRPLVVNDPLAGFVASLPGRVPGDMDPVRAQGIADLAEDVRRAVWEPPAGFDDPDWLTFHWLDRDRPVRDFGGARRRLVVSPFLNRDGIEQVWPDGECTIVSRPESFAALEPDYLNGLVEQWPLELFELDDSAALPDEDDDDTAVRWALRGLHAKVYVEERSRKAHVLVGSANATGAAWGGNTEFVVELVGSARRFGVAAVLAEIDGGFRQVLRRVEPADIEHTDDGPTLQQQLEWALVDVAANAFTATVTASSDGWNEQVTTADPVPGSLPGDATLTVRLLTTGDTRPVEPGSSLSATWGALAPEHVTPYLVVELATGSARASCIAMATLVGGPDDRLDRMIATQVGDVKAFLRFLMLLLQLGRGDDSAIAALVAGNAATSSTSRSATPAGQPLEALVVALADHPQTLDEIDRLVSHLTTTEAGRDVLPAGWDELWSAIAAARAQLEVT